MPRRNIWINAENDKHLKEEENMSGLINGLLSQHYQMTESPPMKIKKTANKKEKMFVHDVDSEDFKKGLKPGGKAAINFCPNNHPIPNGKTKCLGKGCKHG